MQPKVMSYSDFKDQLRETVLSSLDGFAARIMETDRVNGWKDSELPKLFEGLDGHARALAERINAGHEPNSAFVRIDMDE